MKRTFILSLGLISVFFCHAQVIDSLTGPRVWLRGDLSLASSTSWKDISFFKNDATSVSTEEMPSDTSLLNFNRAFLFDGVNDYLKIQYSLDNLAELSIFTVFQSGDTTERGIFGLEESTTRQILLTTRRAMGPDTIVDRYGSYEKTLALSSLIQSWDNSAPPVLSTAYMALGSSGRNKPYKPLFGSLAEVIVYNRSLSFLERIQVETYLAIKYGTGLTSNFIDSKEKLLWHQEKNATFGKHVAGIGRDDFFALYQKQSASAYDSGLLIISAGSPAKDNASNNSVIADGNFLLVGSNGLPMTLKKGDDADSLLNFIQRKWLAVASGPSMKNVSTEFHVDASRFPGDPMGYWLVIDRSGSDNFSIDNLEYITPAFLSNGKVVYNNLLWDTDGSGKDHFGFAKMVSPFALLKILNDPSCAVELAGKVGITIISGQPPFVITLSDQDGKLLKDWKQSENTLEVDKLDAGKYTFQIADNTKEKVTRYTRLTMPDALTINLGEDKSLISGQEIVLDISEQIPDSIEVLYQWQNNYGFSSTDQKVTVNESGVYQVLVTKTSDGCVFKDEIIISGTEEPRYAVYPNITQSDQPLNISVSLPETSSVEVKLYNAHGILVTQMKGGDKSEYQFTTKIKDPGLYMIVIQSSIGVETRKVIIY